MSSSSSNVSLKTTMIVLAVLMICGIVAWNTVDKWGFVRTPTPTQANISGKYLAKCQTSSGTEVRRSLELTSDGHFVYWERETDGTGITGSFSVIQNEITFTFEGGTQQGLAVRASIEDHTGGSSIQDTVARMAEENGPPKCIVTNDEVLGKSTDGSGIHYIRQN